MRTERLQNAKRVRLNIYVSGSAVNDLASLRSDQHLQVQAPWTSEDKKSNVEAQIEFEPPVL